MTFVLHKCFFDKYLSVRTNITKKVKVFDVVIGDPRHNNGRIRNKKAGYFTSLVKKYF